MGFIRVSSWIPRSYTHVTEIGSKLDSLKLPVTDVRIEDSLYFNITSKGGRKVSARLTPYGLFSFTSEFKDSQINEEIISSFKNEVENLLIKDIFSEIQQVTYQQIKDGILPLSFHAVVVSSNYHPKNLDEQDCGDIKLYLNSQRLYSADSDLYVCTKSDLSDSEAIGFFSYTVLTSRYVNQMVEVMSGIYKKGIGVKKTLEEDEFETLKDVLISIGGIKQDCSERYGKILQAVSNFSHARQTFTQLKLSGTEEQLAFSLRIEDGFEHLSHDSDYLMPLWSDVLIKNLDNLSFMINARIELQESVETRKEQKEMKLLQAIFLVGVITSIITLGSMPAARINLYSPSGELLAKGTLASFNIETLAYFGAIAIVVSLFFFSLFNYVYTKISKFIFK